MFVTYKKVFLDANDWLKSNFMSVFKYSILVSLFNIGILFITLIALILIGQIISSNWLQSEILINLLKVGLMAVTLLGLSVCLSLLQLITNVAIVRRVDDQVPFSSSLQDFFSWEFIKLFMLQYALKVFGAFVLVVYATLLVPALPPFILLSLIMLLIILNLYWSAPIVIGVYKNMQNPAAGYLQITNQFSAREIVGVYIVQLILIFLLNSIVTLLFILVLFRKCVMVAITKGMINGVQTQTPVHDNMEVESMSEKDTYVLENEQMKIEIETAGAQLKSIMKDGKELMWQRDEQYWAKSSPVLFPFIGKLKDDQYIVGDQIYAMKQHGFLRERIFTVKEQFNDSIEFEYTSDLADFDRYPFDFTVTIKYELVENQVRTEYTVKNNTNIQMPYQIGAHPAFNVTSVDDLHLVFPHQQVTKHYFENGLQTAVEENYDLHQVDLSYAAINQNLPCYSDFTYKQVDLYENEELRFKFKFDTMSHLTVWSPEGKNAKFICIEPWLGISARVDQADLQLSSKDAMQVLSPYQRATCGYTIEVV